MKIEKIINELKNMEGQVLGSGYFKHEVTSPGKLEVSIFDVLNELKDYEIDMYDMVEYDEEKDIEKIKRINYDELYDDYDDIFDNRYQEISWNNSYNWNSPISNHIDYQVFRDLYDDSYLYRLRVHYGISDVRYGYSDNIWLKIDGEYDFIEIIQNCSKIYSVMIDNIKYNIIVDFYGDGIEVLNDICVIPLDYEESEKIIDKVIENNLI